MGHQGGICWMEQAVALPAKEGGEIVRLMPCYGGREMGRRVTDS